MNIIVEDLKEKISIEEFIIWFHGLYAKYKNVKKLNLYFVKENEIVSRSDNYLYYSSQPSITDFPLTSDISFIMKLTAIRIEKKNIDIEITAYYYKCQTRGILINTFLKEVSST